MTARPLLYCTARGGECKGGRSVSDVADEEVVAFTLAEAPGFREAKKR
jgi:hypothetical protein